MILQQILIVLIVASWLFWLAAVLVVRAWMREREPGDPSYTPPVSILKPVRGLDAEAYENFHMLCHLDYPVYEILFGIQTADDPVIGLIERLKREHPDCRIRSFITPPLGANPKAGSLHYLAAQAAYDTLVISDSDMRVTPDYLRRVVAPLADESIGLVTCPYRAAKAATLTARLAALHMGVCFFPGVAVGRHVLGMRFAMGATCALRKADLERIGGFAAIADYLADDYQLGARIAAAGRRVHLSKYFVVNILGSSSWHEQWLRELRWARCGWVSRRLEYIGLLLSFSTPLSLLLVLVMGPEMVALAALALSIFIRWWVAKEIAQTIGDEESLRWLIWLPARDLLSAIVWLAGALGRRIIWRGLHYRLTADGRLVALETLALAPGENGVSDTASINHQTRP